MDEEDNPFGAFEQNANLSSGFAFATWVKPGPVEADVLMLAKSVREFAGRHSSSPIVVYSPSHSEGELSPGLKTALNGLQTELRFVGGSRELLQFPYSIKVLAAAAAEEQTVKDERFLAFLDPDCLVLQPPDALALPPHVGLGCRPVFSPNIGSRVDEPMDDFWSRLTAECDLPEERLFPVETAVAGIRLRFYINPGLLVVRPSDGHLRAWRDEFLRLYRTPLGQPLRSDRLEHFYFHQTVLSVAVAKRLTREDVLIYPDTVGYAIAYHDRYAPNRRHETIDELLIVRHENFFDVPGWEEGVPAGPALRDWIVAGRAYAEDEVS
jgi:hypothetical protein